jgi:hypothetical protein
MLPAQVGFRLQSVIDSVAVSCSALDIKFVGARSDGLLLHWLWLFGSLFDEASLRSENC